MIPKLKRKFILLATVSMLSLMTMLILIMNLVNYSSVIRECDTVLDLLAERNHPGQGENLPERNNKKTKPFPDMPRNMSPEVPFESRYFSVLIAADGTVIKSDFSKIISVDDNSLRDYLTPALKSKNQRGFSGQFRYDKQKENQFTRILFLDCGRKLDSFRLFMRTSIAVGFFGCLIAFLIFLFAAGRILRPVAESYEKQKRFITDAGHEIKTPLTVINANLDLLEWDGNQTEESAEIRNQIRRLSDLTRDLVSLSKMEEAGYRLPKVEFPLSDLVTETVASFHALFLKQNITLNLAIKPDLSFCGSPDDIRKLVALLLENALKYSPTGGNISVSLKNQRKSLLLAISNQTVKPVGGQDLSLLFDRFYRSDISRNSATGGSGIGLSMAKAITEAHNGTIRATLPQENEFCIHITLPLKK